MFVILLGIIFTTSLVICFKYFDKLNINTFHAILVNYIIAALTSYFYADKNFAINYSDPWFSFSVGIGLLFILTFVATSITAQRVSVIVSMISAKMSLVIPLTYAVLFIGEKMTYLKITAIILAMAGVVLTVLQPKKDAFSKPRNARAILLIAAVFIGSGFVDSSFKFIEFNYYSIVPQQYIMMVCYASAGVFATIYFLLSSLKTRPVIKLRSVIGGVILGVLNYFSFHFVIEALHIKLMPSSVVIPIINVGVLLLSTLLAMVLFRERLRTINYFGVVISILSIIILALQYYVV
jgi:drug/metabolite transporter (DMT)-like permease